MSDNPVVRLREHAGLNEPSVDYPKDTVIEFAVNARRGDSQPDLEPLVDDVVSCLCQLHAAPDGGTTIATSLGVVYAMSNIIGLLLDLLLEGDSNRSSAIVEAVWRINCAWDALLAGDVNDLREHVDMERRARRDRP